MKRFNKKAPGFAGRTSVAPSDAVARELAQIETMPIAALRDLWRLRFGFEPPPIQSGDILGRLIAWKIQVDAFGDLSVATRARIDQIGRSGRNRATGAATTALRAGTVLIREWRGVEHRVLVLEHGFEHRDRRYRSLSEVARAITGSHWSGPRFFGLEARPVAHTRGDRS